MADITGHGDAAARHGSLVHGNSEVEESSSVKSGGPKKNLSSKAKKKLKRKMEMGMSEKSTLMNGSPKSQPKRRKETSDSDEDEEPQLKKTRQGGIEASSSTALVRNEKHEIAASADVPAAKMEKICGAVRTILECIGEDPNRPGLLDSPARYAKAMLYFTKGYEQSAREIIRNAIWDDEGHNHHGMVIERDIEIFSLCEHHLVPFTGKMHIGYIPTTRVVGLSKLARIAEMFSRRLQIQERLTKEVAAAVMEELKPQGVAVVMEAKHLCMVMRGVEKTSTSTITSCVLGCFERSSKTRNEFLSLLRLEKNL